MREIRFRGILKGDNLPYYHKGQWVYGDYVRLCDGKRNIPHIYGCGEIEANTVGQYIGLVDKNGKEIYEGDIVKVYFVDGYEVGTIVYSESAYRFKVEQGTVGYCFDSTLKCEIIGNIHDNPELLKGGA